MTKDEIISMALEADAAHDTVVVTPFLEHFAVLVANFAEVKEREACKALADCAFAESSATYEHCISVRDINFGLVAAGAKAQAKKLSEAISARGR